MGPHPNQADPLIPPTPASTATLHPKREGDAVAKQPDVLDIAERLWTGEISTSETHPIWTWGGLAEVADGVAFTPSFANVSALDTDEGLFLVDTGSSQMAGEIHRTLRDWSDSRLNTAVYSHGHIDHVFGVPVWEAESEANGWAPPTVIAHHAPPRTEENT